MAEEKKKEDALDKFFKKFHPIQTIVKFVTDELQFEPYFIGAVLLIFFLGWLPGHLEAGYYVGIIFFFLIIFVLPFLLWRLLVDAWFEYRRNLRYHSLDYCVLQIRLPEEITQSPYAAELMLRGLYQTGDVDTDIAYIMGNYSPWFSLEIASDGGRVSFYIWTQRRFKQLVENQIYAHYPTVQVVEVPDYTLATPYDPAVVSIFGVEQALQKPDPYPILTYEEAGTLKAGEKEEFKQDPLAGVLEFMGSIKEGEHVWTQFIIRAHQKGTPAPYALEKAHEELDLEKWAQKEVETIAENVKDAAGKFNYNNLTQGDKDKIQAIQMKMNKQLFEVGIRSIYIARNDVFGGGPRAGIPSTLRHFEHGSDARGLNGLKPVFWIGRFNFPWQDFMNIRRRMLWARYYDAYVSRQFFFAPHKHRHIILNTEELATLYHFPGTVVRTPTLERMPSRRGGAPANLPV